MLTNDQLFILDALRTALQIKPEGLSAWKDAALHADEVARIITNGGIILTVFPVLNDLPGIQDLLRKNYYSAVAQTVKQNAGGTRILHALNDAGFDCIGLKGWEMRTFYPQITMRQMADLDILVRDYRFPVLRTVLAGIGYELTEPESSWMHDNFANGTITLELHKRLTDDSGEIQKWELEMWAHAVPSDEGKHIFRMRDEDFYLYHLLHMHKDFLNGALGLRRIVDTWLFCHTHPDLDQVYLSEQLDRMGLSLFAERMLKLSRDAMGDTEMDENSEIMLNFAFSYGIYGTPSSYKLGRIAALSGGELARGRFHAMLVAVFLPYGRMKAHFPILVNWPILLPWCWLLRILHQLRGNWKENSRMMDYRGLKESEYMEVKRFFRAGGC